MGWVVGARALGKFGEVLTPQKKGTTTSSAHMKERIKKCRVPKDGGSHGWHALYAMYCLWWV